MTKKLIVLLIFGLILRLILMITTIHPDIRGHNLAAYLISQKGEVLGFYDHISKLSRDNRLVTLYGDGLFIYPPLSYLTLAGFMKVLGPLYPWNTFSTLITDIGQVRFDPSWMWLMFLLKFPYLIIDIMAYWWLVKKIENSKKVLFTVLWVFNLPILFSAYMMGQFDIVIGVLILVSAILSAKKTHILSAIILGIAAGFKPFPLLLLPLLGINLQEKIKYTLVGLITYFVIISPYFGSVGFKHYALLASQADKLEYAKILVSGSQYLSLFWVGIILLYWWNYFGSKKMPIWGWYTSALLLFFSVTHWHPQWFTWASGLLIFSCIYKPKTCLPVFILLSCYTFILMTFEPSLNFGLFNINFNLFNWINTRFPADQLISMVRSLFASTSIITILNIKKS